VALSDGSLAEAVQKLTEGKGADPVLDPVGVKSPARRFPQ
jgi:hypothetical protein